MEQLELHDGLAIFRSALAESSIIDISDPLRVELRRVGDKQVLVRISNREGQLESQVIDIDGLAS